MLALILWFFPHLIIIKHILGLITSNNKKSHILTNKNKCIKKTVMKHLLSNCALTKAPKNNNLLIFSFFIVDVNTCKNRHKNKNIDSSKRTRKSSSF